MMIQKILKNKISFVILITSLVGLHILWEYFNGGVTTHHILAREDLPGISNWWGLLTIPLLSWLLISLINKKINDRDISRIAKGFLTSLCFGILMSVLWEFDLENILQYAIWTPVLIALFTRVHFPEIFLGFVLGMTFTFGGVLPIGFGLFLMTMSFLTWIIFRKAIPMIFQKVFKSDKK